MSTQDKKLEVGVKILLKNKEGKYLLIRNNPEKYPGPSSFKAGLRGDDIKFMGTFETYESIISMLLVRIGETIDIFIQKTKSMILDIKNDLLVYFD